MKKHLITSAFALILSLNFLNAQSFGLAAVSDMERVFEDGFRLPAMHDSVIMFGIRGEIISGQFVISTLGIMIRSA